MERRESLVGPAEVESLRARKTDRKKGMSGNSNSIKHHAGSPGCWFQARISIPAFLGNAAGGGQVTACGSEGREDSELEVSSPNYCFTFSPSDPEAAQHQRDHDIALCNCGAQTYQIRGFSIFGNRALHPRFSY